MTHTFKSTSSGPNGFSRRKEWLGCGARAKFQEDREASRSGEPWPLWAEEDEPVATTVGSLTGELLQRWYVDGDLDIKAPFLWDGVNIEDSHPLTCAEARRLVRAYIAEHRRDDLGEIVGVEVPITIPEALFGLAITGSIDMVVRRPSGLFVIDFKTDGQDRLLREKYSLSAQLWIYCCGYELNYSEKPVGCEIVDILKYKEPKKPTTIKKKMFNRFPYEGLTEQRLRWLQNLTDTIKAKQANPRPEPSMDTCCAWGRHCPLLGENLLCSLI